MAELEINNLTSFRISKEFLKEVAKNVLIGENKEKLELSIALVAQNKIRELNKKYRQKNQVTDVLSFYYNGSAEIIICPQRVKKNAEKLNLSFKKELTRVLIHGILHLLGYDHEASKKEAEKMRQKEECYLQNKS